MTRRALVTGGSGAIGAAIARDLAAAGCEVFVHANRNTAAASNVVEGIRADGGRAEVLGFDITDAEATRAALEAEIERGPFQILVHNAGVHDDAPLAGMTPEQWRRPLEVSLHGFYNVVQPALLPMITTRWGRVIAVTSVAGVTGNRGQANYAAAKAGLHGAIKSLAQEVASRGITANAVAPGIVESPMSESAFDADTIRRMVPMRRAGEPAEVAGLVGYLASEAAGYVSGQVIGINGALA
ncbi:3-oxoacyl-ACP reductase FabG [Thioalkalivibrio sp. ALE11]|uniref:3-oxoacyl-ACP reductase FabG n=1 Tax=Thioalkalivibrio sp. ALE11 TaxID=1265494 RepID=UPI0003655838|nr:3-oxoacyl-ACP reductase FabG [Thioalkalivibrio sp. ALE11]